MTENPTESGAFEGLAVGQIAGTFWVPGYQRGYRWTDLEVTRLLQDIQESAGSTYYLQPVVVKPREPGVWELIDGQQRLTTLALIVQAFKTYVPHAEVKYTIEYETRPHSQRFLLDPVEEDAGENIDFFHMYAAWKAIHAWLEEQDDRSTAAWEIYTALTRRVKVIWYEAPAATDSAELFTRLNVGRIPLTDSELVKALVLTRSRDLQGDDRALSVASEWDTIERELRQPELWSFLTSRAGEDPTHIGLLLDTLADRARADSGLVVLRGRERPPFHTFETLRPLIDADPEGWWDGVVDLHSLVVGWYEQRDAFHKIGFLTASGFRFDEILAQSDGATRPEFIARLDAMIASDRHGLNGRTAAEISGLAYGQDDGVIQRALLLMNVETVRAQTNSTERYSFHAHAASKDSWSLEHIHAQNSVGLDTVPQWTDWLRLHRDALADLPTIDPGAYAALRARIDAALPHINLETFQELESEIRGYFSSGGVSEDAEEHAISNLALLERSDNSSLSNAAFEVKRRRILELDRAGSYIPTCTRRVFLKYYTEEHSQQVHFWGPQDRQGYLEAILRTLRPYLKAEAAA